MRRFLVLVTIGLAAGVLLAPAAALAAFGIDPGKVYVDNLYPGAQGEFPITVYNQNDYETTFVVKARGPDYTAEDEGYDALPYLEWVTVTPERVTTGASDTDDVLVIVAMPEDADYSGKKSEVWVSFMEEDTEGMVKIEICSRIFISTRVEEPAEPEAPSVENGGGVGITAEGAEPASPEAEPASPSRWTILGPVLGGVLAGVAIFLVKRKRRQRV